MQLENTSETVKNTSKTFNPLSTNPLSTFSWPYYARGSWDECWAQLPSTFTDRGVRSSLPSVDTLRK